MASLPCAAGRVSKLGGPQNGWFALGSPLSTKPKEGTLKTGCTQSHVLTGWDNWQKVTVSKAAEGAGRSRISDFSSRWLISLRFLFKIQ